MTKTLLSPCRSGNIAAYDFLGRVNIASPAPPPNCVGSGDGVNVGEGVKVAEGVKVRVGVRVDVRVGVDVIVGMGVWVGVSVRVGPDNEPVPQPESKKPIIRVIKPIVFPLALISPSRQSKQTTQHCNFNYHNRNYNIDEAFGLLLSANRPS